MGKSETRKALQTFAPQVFKDKEGSRAVVVIEDMLVRLRGLAWSKKMREYDSVIPIDEVMHLMFDTALGKLEGECDVYVCYFDKHSYTTIAKQPEQQRRDSQVDIEKSKQIKAKTSSMFKGSASAIQLTCAEWADAINCRMTRASVIRALFHMATEWIAKEMQDREVPASRFLILDCEGHKEEASQLPLVVYPTGIRFDESIIYHNTIGEYDVAVQHYIHHPNIKSVVRSAQKDTEEDCHVLIDSVDTDMLAIALLHSQPLQQAPSLRWTSTSTGEDKRKETRYFDPLAFREWLQQAFGDGEAWDNEQMEMQVIEFVKMYILAGSDFVPGVAGVSHHTLMTTFLGHQGRKSAVQVIRSAIAGKPIKLTGSKRASQLAQKRNAYSLDDSVKRTDWCLNYWQHSGYDTHKLYASPLGHGFGLGGDGRVVYAETICAAGQEKAKKIKVI